MQLRRQASNLRLASNSRASFPLDHAGSKGGGSRTRTCGRATVYALATRCLANSAMPPETEGEGVEPPRPEGPTVFETVYRATGSPSMTPAGVEPALPRVRAGSYPLSYGVVRSSVAGRNRTCGALRFRQALYRAELRPLVMKQMTRPAEAERCFPSHSPTLRPWIANRRVRLSSYVEGLWSPIPERLSGKAHAKAHAPIPAPFRALSAERSFSLRRGLDSF